MANDLDDIDGAEGGPQPAEGRELVVVDLGHPNHDAAAMAVHRAAELAGASRPDM